MEILRQDYTGPERRTGYCDQHFGEQLQSKTNCSNIENLQKDIDKKVPLWALLPLLGLLISIFGIQWATYTKMTDFTLCVEKRLSLLEERQTVLRDSVNRVQQGANRP